jgi:hypothetical protein
MNVRCARCPVADGIRCGGLDVPRFCELIDPSCPHFNPGYRDVIVRESHRCAERYPTALSVRLVRLMNACEFRSTDPTCGCTGGRCGLRAGVAVGHLDCFECIRRYEG